jgi:hypothetical protein
MTDQNDTAQAAEQPLPSYGKLPFHQLGQDVVEAMMGVRQPFDFGPSYPGHAMCLINFNSLARIVDKYRVPVASAPVAGEANTALNEWLDKTDFIQKRIACGELPVKYLGWHRADVMRDLIENARPSDDKLWNQTLAERDEYHDMADKLANAIADHLLVEIGEHSSSNCPWMRALEAIENAAPQASEAVR